MPRQLVAGAMDGQVGTESTGVCGPRTEAGDGSTPRTAQPSLLTLVRLAGDEAGRFLFLFFVFLLTSLLLKMRQMDKLAGGGRFVRPGAGTDL